MDSPGESLEQVNQAVGNPLARGRIVETHAIEFGDFTLGDRRPLPHLHQLPPASSATQGSRPCAKIIKKNSSPDVHAQHACPTVHPCGPASLRRLHVATAFSLGVNTPMIHIQPPATERRRHRRHVRPRPELPHHRRLITAAAVSSDRCYAQCAGLDVRDAVASSTPGRCGPPSRPRASTSFPSSHSNRSQITSCLQATSPRTNTAPPWPTSNPATAADTRRLPPVGLTAVTSR